MKKRHINLLMLIFSIIGGIIGYIVGEVLLNMFRFRLPDVLVVGIYFAVFSFCVVFMCLLAELIKPRLTNTNWKKVHLKKCWLMIIPLTVVAMFVVGCVTQFIYGLDIPKVTPTPVDDYIFIMDNSGSMAGSDPDSKRIEAINELVDNLDESNRVAYYSFTIDTNCDIPFSPVNQSVKNKLHDSIGKTQSSGGTNILLALQTAFNDIQGQLDPKRTTALVLISDGEDYFDTNLITDQCKAKNVRIDTIGLGISMGSSGRVMSQLADETNGGYYDLQSADQIFGVLDSVKQGKTNTRNLLDRRYGEKRTAPLYMIERVLFIACFGVLLGLALGLLFDNKQLIKNFLIGGSATGLLAGLLMEIGLYNYMNTRACRMGMDILLALVMCLFTLVVPYEIDRVTTYSKLGQPVGTDYTKINSGIQGQFGANDHYVDDSRNQFM